MTDRRQFILCAAASAIGCTARAGDGAVAHDAAKPRCELKDERAAYEAWLAGELERAKSYGGRVILASHIPPFAFRYDEKDSYDNHPLAGRSGRLESYVSSGARFYLSAHQHRLAVRGYKNLVILGAEATCDNFDIRPQGFRMFEVNDDFSYSWNFVEV